MFRLITLPTHPSKEDFNGEELDEGEIERGKSKLRSIEDSLVLLQGLRQSRQTWLTSAFVKFSAKSRAGKGGDIWQPPHTIRFRGRCDLEIGPHVFYTTSVYEVTYQPYSIPVQPSTSSASISTQPLSTVSQIQLSSTSTSSTGAATGNTQSTNAVVSSLDGTIPITNELIVQVNAAALSDPALAELLRVAAAGHATKEQLHILGVRMLSLADAAKASQTSPANTGTAPQIQQAAGVVTSTNHSSSSATSKGTSTVAPVLSLRPTPSNSSTINAPNAQQQTYQTMQVVHKEPDVVIEFYENSADRWLLPKDLVLYEKAQRWDNNNTLADIIFSTIFPFEGTTKLPQPIEQSEEGQTAPPLPDFVHPITLRFFNVPLAIWTLFAPAANNLERTKRVSAAMDAKLDKAAPRAYLQHRISDATLLSQLQASAADRYPMKSIKPAPGAIGSTKRRTAPPKNGQNNPAQKRRRTAPVKKTESRTGTCDICKRASIVLAPQSPYCPPCTKKVAAGEAVPPPASPRTPATLVSQTTSAHDTIGTQPKTPNNSSAPVPSSSAALAPSATGIRQPSKAASKSKKPRKDAATLTFKAPTVPAPYPPGVRPSLPNYYTWQPGTHYAYYQHPSTLQPGQSPNSNPLPVMPPYPSIYAQAGQAAVQQAYPAGVPPATSPSSVRPSSTDIRPSATAALKDKDKDRDKSETSSGSHAELFPET